MKNLLSISLSLLLLTAGQALAVSVPTSIDSVVVYGDGATVTRTGQLSLSAGETEVEFSGLSSMIDPDRVQLEVLGDGIEPGQIRFEQVQQRDAFDAQVRALQAQVDAQQLKVTGINDATETARLELKFLEGIAQGYAKESWFEGARGAANVESWRAALKVLADGSGSARATIRENTVRLRDEERELARLNRELQALRGKRPSSLTVSVAISAARAGDVRFRLHYYMDDAYWSPLYEARLDSQAGQLRLIQKAAVAQTTDEDWRNARLTLSTSEPSQELIPPQVSSEFVDIFDPRPQLEMFSKLQRQSMPAPAAADMQLEEIVVTGSRRAERDIGAYAVSYTVPGRVTVNNDADDDQVFELDRFEFEPRLVTRIVPRESMTAFLTAQFDYDQPAPLYGERMAVYVDGVYAGESFLPTMLPGAEISLPMGQDRRVSFTVRDQGGEKGEGGFIGRRKSELTSTLFEINNRRNIATAVEVIDRYPVAVNEDVDISIPDQATEPDETNFEDRKGVIVWRKTLQPDETWRINHAYEISYPADKAITRNER